MNSRLTIQDLAGLLSERTGKDRNSAEQFLREFIAIVSQGVFTDKMVKVKGLGTFKIVLVENRESIHVNTGERFMIPAHYKFSFLPDKELRELVNKPFSFFETTELNEEVDFTDLDISNGGEDKEVEDESVEEILPENIPVTEETTDIPEPALQEAEEPAFPEEIVSKEAESVMETVTETSLPEPEPAKVTEEPATQPEKETGQPTLASDFSETDYQFEDEEPRASRWGRVWVSIGVAALVLAACFFLYQHRSFFIGPEIPQTASLAGRSLPETAALPSDSLPTLSKENPPRTDSLENRRGVEEKQDTVLAPSPQPEIKPEAQTPDILAKVKIEPGSRLTLISLEYYGSKIFWVYLYEFNKSIIKDPNNVPIGTEIQVPAPELYGINKHSRASLEKAAARQTEILSGNR